MGRLLEGVESIRLSSRPRQRCLSTRKQHSVRDSAMSAIIFARAIAAAHRANIVPLIDGECWRWRFEL